MKGDWPQAVTNDAAKKWMKVDDIKIDDIDIDEEVIMKNRWQV